MSGNDRRTAFLRRLEKIRELIASFFRAFTQDEVHHDCLRSNRTAPYRISQCRPAASAFRTFTGLQQGRCHHRLEKITSNDDEQSPERRESWSALILDALDEYWLTTLANLPTRSCSTFCAGLSSRRVAPGRDRAASMSELGRRSTNAVRTAQFDQPRYYPDTGTPLEPCPCRKLNLTSS